LWALAKGTIEKVNNRNRKITDCFIVLYGNPKIKPMD